MDTSPLIFDIQRTDSRDFLNDLREEFEGTTHEIYSEEEMEEVRTAIALRFSQLNALDLVAKRMGDKS